MRPPRDVGAAPVRGGLRPGPRGGRPLRSFPHPCRHPGALGAVPGASPGSAGGGGGPGLHPQGLILGLDEVVHLKLGYLAQGPITSQRPGELVRSLFLRRLLVLLPRGDRVCLGTGTCVARPPPQIPLSWAYSRRGVHSFTSKLELSFPPAPRPLPAFRPYFLSPASSLAILDVSSIASYATLPEEIPDRLLS